MKKSFLALMLLCSLWACKKESPNVEANVQAKVQVVTPPNNPTNPVNNTHGTLVVKNSNRKCFAIVLKNSINPLQVAAGETIEKSYPIGVYTYSVICGLDSGMPGCCSVSGLLKNDKTFEIKANEKTMIGGVCY
jgi:hypothetical protein